MLVFLLPYLIVNAQDQLVVIICPAKTLPVAKYNVASLEQEPQIPDNDPTNNMYLGKNPLVFKDNIYIVRFFNTTSNKLLKIGDLDKEMNVEIVANGKRYERNIDKREYKMTDLNLDFGEILGGDNIPQGSEISITVNIKNENFDILSNQLVTRFHNPKQLYQALGQDLKGFWFPTLLFSTNFKSTESGIPFASLPIGLAWGCKFYGKKGGGFVGISGMGNWLIYTQDSRSTTTSNTSFNVAGITGGVLVDFSDVISIGYAYGANFKSGGKDPGSMFVLGVGSKALNFFKKDKEVSSSNNLNLRDL